MTKELKCPKCGSSFVDEYDCYETIFGEGDTFKELFSGYCMDCGAELQWERVYEFVGYDNIEEG